MDVFKTLIHSQPGAVGSNVAITGGSVNGTNIGATTPGTGAFTTLSASSTSTLTGTVTTSTINGPTTTALTLAGGSSGASLVLGQGANGAINLTPVGTGETNAYRNVATTYTTAGNTNAVIGVWNTNTTANNAAQISFSTNDGGTIRGGATIGTIFTARSASASVTGILTFATNSAAASATEKMRLTDLGNLLIGGTTDISGSGGLKVFGTTAATNTTSGAVQIGSNIGLSGNSGGPSYFGGNVWIGEAGNLAPNTVDKYIGVSVTSTADFPAHVLSVTDGVKNVRGSQFIDASTTQERWIWDVGYSSASNVSYEWRIGASQKMLLRETGGLSVSDTTASTSATTGALQVSGGVGASGAVWIGGAYTSTVSAGLNLSGMSIPAITLQTSNASGRNFMVASNYAANGTLSVTGSTTAGGNATVELLRFDPTTSLVTVTPSTASTSVSTGALVSMGGIGAAGAANVGTYYGMVDGVTAPGATVGYAKIYVDTADGDLKVVFGDGTIKTIATDT